jgi:hypothetical protein
MPVLTPEEYRKRASEIYDPSYAVKVANENSAFNNTMSQYQNQGNMINSEFDRTIQANARNTAMNQNQFNNNTLSRGMARSSVATTGLAGIQNTGNRVAGEIEQNRTQQVNNLETLKTNLRANLESSLKALSNEREGGINSMAMQLQQRDEDIQRQLDAANEDKRRYDQEWTFKKEQAAKDEAYRQQQLKVSAAKKSSGGSTKPASGLTAKQITEYKKQIEEEMMSVSHNPTERENWINQNQAAIMAAVNNDATFLDNLKKKTGEGAGYYYGTQGYSLH